ncbi:MAG: PilC/PilY family type IV pilus protein [Candidatus Parabeggiatoa sp.]|nr:PilC/PilY family type IV pilus protein [Candidatus Parabeggiatoa sp.]
MKFCTLLISLTLTLLAGLSTSVFADDTEIYVRKVEAVDESTRPNMLFVLDNSGSMNESLRNENTGIPTGERRIDVLKEALVKMLDNATNVNVGLARFASLIKNNDPKNPHVNVPILFPVTHIDANIHDMDGEEDDSIMDASMSIAQSSDDAEQNLGSGKMTLNDPELQMVHILTEEEPNGIKVVQEIQEAADDAVEFIEDSNKVRPWDTPIIYLGTDPDKGETLVGLRFKELGIPKGATIVDAKVEFMSDDAYDTEVQIVISGAANDGVTPVKWSSPPIVGDPSGTPFGNTQGYLSGEGYPKDGKNFPPTSTSVTWKPDKIEAPGQRFKTDNIGGIIQEIVKRDGWHDHNGLVLLLKKASSSSADARRGFYTRDSSEDPPKLRVCWTLPETKISVISGWDTQTESVVTQNQLAETENTQKFNDQHIRLGKQLNQNYLGGGDETLVGIRFEAMPLPQGAKIIEAKLTFTHQSGSEPEAGKELLNLLVSGDKSPDAEQLTQYKQGGKVSERLKTNTFVTWDGVPETDVGEDPEIGKPFTLADPQLAAILQEITDQPDWKSGNDVAFIFERNGEPDAPNTGFRRIVGSRDHYLKSSDNSLVKVDKAEIEPNENTLPRLQVKFSVGLLEETEIKNPDLDKQIVGLRFEAVDIPQGATITSAAIQFVSGPDTSGPAKLIIKAENAANAKTFTEENNNISNRPTTREFASWDIEAWTEGVTYSTPDLKRVVQEVVNHSDWCGGEGGLAFIISTDSGNPLRNVKSYDDRPGYAPVLKVEFDSKDIKGNGCVNQNFIGQIAAENDDAEQKMSGGEAGLVYLASDALEFPVRGGEARLAGLRFNDIPIGKNATILKAQLILTARNDGDKNTLANIWGEKSDNANVFTNNDHDLGKRLKTTKTVAWAPGPWERNKLYRSPDISPIIQEIVNETDWEIYNSLALLLGGSTGQRDISSFRAGPTSAAKLLIQVKGYLGESGQGDLMTVRRRLKKIVKKMEIPPSTTPIVDALYESALYFRGGQVDYGKDRHNQAEYLVSHPATYSGGGSIVRDDKCKINVKPLDENCASEKITGQPIYDSPIKSSCQTNHIIFLSDGIATRNTAEDKVKQLLSLNNCVNDYPDPDDPENGESIKVPYSGKCGIEMADFLYNQDHLNKRQNTENTENNITVHTIGFQLGTAWRVKYLDEQDKDVYKKDGIYYYDKEGTKEVPNDLAVQKDGYETNSNGTKQNEQAVKYLKRLASVSKSGDKKRNFYPADTVEDLTKAFEDITAQAMTTSSSFAAPGVSINNFNSLEHNEEVYYALFEPGQYRYWKGNVKRFRISEKGEVLDKSGNVALENNHIKEGAIDFWDESSSSTDQGGTVLKGGVGSQLNNIGSAGRNIYTYLGDASPGNNHEINLARYPIEVVSGDEDFDKALTQALLGDDIPEDEALAEEARHYLIKWIRGEDVSLVEGVASSGSDDRWMFGDPLHSTPKMITYGGDEHNQKNKLFVGTNDGLIRMLNTDSGKEEWAFLPQELLPLQKILAENPSGVDRIYGVDNTPTFWINDGNDNEINPEAGDFVKMFMAMRRGGRNIYALDVTGKKGSLGSPPKLMWVIKGGEGDFEKLGQTWSSPRPTVVDPSYCHVINANAQGCIVLLFGGGYNPTQDEGVSKISTEASRMGNAIYMVHAETGQLLWWASSADEADLVLEKMTYSIPSAVTMLDSDSDDNTDLIYVGDIGGQVWRIELLGKEKTRGGRLAWVSEKQNIDVARTERRSFFYPPAITDIKGKYVIAMMSGTRPHPLYGGNDVRDQFYVFRDQKWDEDKNELRTLTPEKNMVDVTGWSEGSQVNLMELDGDKQGWYLNLADGGSGSALSWIGEKGITTPMIVDEMVVFTTYVPSQGENDACHFNEGESRLYILFLLSGGPAYDVINEKFDTKEKGDETSDRFIPGGDGPGGGPVIVRTPGTGNRTELSSKTNFGSPPVTRTFWMQKEGCGL